MNLLSLKKIKNFPRIWKIQDFIYKPIEKKENQIEYTKMGPKNIEISRSIEIKTIEQNKWNN